ncbi:MAG: DapH/DapD/GlmU-related protein [Acidobacteriota bacterium]|nr:DapH/DapD/GlmU-related protein [Acidobacteriota bacterium]
MITAYIDGGPGAADGCFFRGRPLGFWIERSFPFCRFLDTLRSVRDSGPVLVFSTDLLPVLNEAGSRELRRRLRGSALSLGGFFAPVGNPFFVVSRSFLKKSGIPLGRGAFRALRTLPGVGELEMKNPVTALNPRRDSLAIEPAITTLQAAYLQKRGVGVENAGNFCIEGLPPIGRGSFIGSGIVMRGDCRIGRNVALYPNCFIANSRIGDNCVILPGSVILDSQIERNVQLGPYCHVRLGSLVREGAKMGNFVEMKKSVLGRGSKAMHLSYIGDATVGSKVNIGAGTITCNYDGKKKNPTIIGDNVFIGSGTELVAPITVSSDSYVGAGSTITEDVPRYALALARQRQKNIAGWVTRKRKK